ncbi:MAG: hypothetical protein AB8F94_17455 [Saprospiraceae bacterium]
MKDDILDEGPEFLKKSPNDYVEIINLKRALAEDEKKVEHGTYAVWVLIIITVIAAIYEMSVYNETALLLGIYIPILVIYFGCVFFMKSKPHMAFIIVLSVYGIVQLLGMLGDPMALIRGLLLKIILIYYLAVAISAAGKYEQAKKRLYDLEAD